MHFLSNKSDKLQGYCTYDAFSEVLAKLLEIGLGSSDLVFVTGDISQDESLESYRLALSQFEKIGADIYWIPGNHDDEYKLNLIFSASKNMRRLRTLSTDHWDFISINTCRVGTDEGHIEQHEMASFKRELAKSQNDKKNIVVVMHHHPVPVATPLMDECMLKNNQDFLNVLAGNSEIKLIICGHVHGDYKILLNDKFLETCPATCFQWEKGTSIVKPENSRGFKIFNFSENSYTSSTLFV